MNIFFQILSIVIRIMLFFVVVRNITRNKYYGWDTRDYTGIVIVVCVLIWGWFSSYGILRFSVSLFLIGTIAAAIFEGLDNRKGALISSMFFLSLIILLFLV